MEFPNPPRIRITGLSGSGKTALGKELASILSVNHLEEDSINFTNNFVLLDQKIVVKRGSDFVNANKASGYVTDGFWRTLSPVMLPYCNVVISLEYPYYIVFWRLLKRTLYRIFVAKDSLWGLEDCKETFMGVFFPRNWEDSVLYFSLGRKLQRWWNPPFDVKQDWYENGYPSDFPDAWKGERVLLKFLHPSQTAAFVDSLRAKYS
ncbi:hypothetical protein HDV06_005487 [Boothiomyces sp. JEL0866]|nr:hypothetical protein HDV06_005487 [Boothiomyces sp. JEL0866]